MSFAAASGLGVIPASDLHIPCDQSPDGKQCLQNWDLDYHKVVNCSDLVASSVYVSCSKVPGIQKDFGFKSRILLPTCKECPWHANIL